jgi:phospholipase D1/2
VYIENQFFITATSEAQKPVKNMIAGAIVERIIRAARERQNYQMVVLIPSVPAFAGDLQSEGSLGTRAIMEFQYDSINRGGHSIYEKIAQAGYNPLDYIRFYNLRNYDRINNSGVMASTEKISGINYEAASEAFDAEHGGNPPANMPGQDAQNKPNYPPGAAETYEQAANQSGDRQGLGDGKWDTVSSCYMLNGEDIRTIPWEKGNIDEIDAIVTEELYIHTKVFKLSLC